MIDLVLMTHSAGKRQESHLLKTVIQYAVRKMTINEDAIYKNCNQV